MDREDIKAKIRKLLTLAERGNEYEAKVAMAKAQMLMAQYKIRESDCKEQSKVISKELTLYFTAYKNNYLLYLIDNLSEFYCCKAFVSYSKGSKKRFICLMGFEDDVNIFENVLLFVHSCICDWFREYKREYKHKYTNEYFNAIKNQYGRGFAEGLKDLIEEQTKRIEEEWGLVMQAPKEAKDFIKDLKPIKENLNCADEEIEIHSQGYFDGYHAEINNKIGENRV